MFSGCAGFFQFTVFFVSPHAPGCIAHRPNEAARGERASSSPFSLIAYTLVAVSMVGSDKIHIHNNKIRPDTALSPRSHGHGGGGKGGGGRAAQAASALSSWLAR